MQTALDFGAGAGHQTTMTSALRSLWIPATLQTALAGLLCFVPLFNLLGFEYSLAVGLMAVPTGLAIGLRGARADAGGTLRGVGRTAAGALAHLLPGLLLISANALRVRNCDYLEGLAFFLVLPVPTAVYAAMLGHAIGLVLRDGRRRTRIAVAFAVALAPLLATLWRLYWQPPIFAYDHLWGHFAGSLYDEVIRIGRPLLALRAGTVARMLLLLVFVGAWQRRARLGRRGLAVVAIGLFVAAGLYDVVAGDRFGFRVDRDDIEEELPQTVERPHLVIHLPARVDEETREAIADDHAFRLQQLERALGIEVDGVIHSYVYANAADKARLMGGRGTQVAKPWLEEIHIHDAVHPHPIAAHELVHVVAARFGTNLLGVSARWGLAVNMGLVEGLAEALTVERGEFTLDRWTRALRILGKAPDLREIIGPAGFWSQPPRRAYTVAGSFVRHLLERYGAEPLRAAYANGDFEAAYDKTLDELVDEWESRIDTIELDDRELRAAEERFRRPSIFRRPCAHEIAQLRARATRAPAPEAVGVYQAICDHLGNSPDCQLDLALAYQRADDTAAFMRLCERLLESDGLNAVQKGRLLEGRGNAQWEAGDLADAVVAFREVRDLELGRDSERLQWVRLWALDREEPLREQLRRFLTQDLPPLAAVLLLAEAHAAAPDDKTLPYLIARQVLRVGEHEQALPWLDQSTGHPSGTIEAERIRLRAAALWQLERLDQAEQAFLEYAERAPSSGERARALDWVERIRWTREQKKEK